MIDLATNLNPFSQPAWFDDFVSENISSLSEYPELWHRKVDIDLSNHFSLNACGLLISPGGSTILYQLPQLYEAYKSENVKWGVVSPSFWEYEKSLEANGSDYSLLSLNDDLECSDEDYFQKILEFCKQEKIDNLFLCIPNNPTGHHVPAQKVLELLDNCPSLNITLDLTYAFFESEHNEYIDLFKSEFKDRLIGITSLSKFFSLPGLRLGYSILGDKNLGSYVRELMGPVRVNSIAEKAIIPLLQDVEHIEGVRKRLEILQDKNAQVNSFPWLSLIKSRSAYSFFRLDFQSAQDTPAKELKEFLSDRKIKIMDASSYGMSNHVRIRTCTVDENKSLLGACEEFQSLHLDNSYC